METLPVTPGRKAQLEEYAKEQGQSTAEALDDLLAAQLDWQQCEYDETVQAALQGYADVTAWANEGRRGGLRITARQAWPLRSNILLRLKAT